MKVAISRSLLIFAYLKGNMPHVLCSFVNTHSTTKLTTAIWLIFLQLRHAFGYGYRKQRWKHAMKTCILPWTLKYIRPTNMVIVEQKCAQPALFSSQSQEAQVLPMCNSTNVTMYIIIWCYTSEYNSHHITLAKKPLPGRQTC